MNHNRFFIVLILTVQLLLMSGTVEGIPCGKRLMNQCRRRRTVSNFSFHYEENLVASKDSDFR